MNGQRAEANAGFTLIEALVAFVVLAVLTIATQQAVVTSAAGTARADTRIQSEMVARTLMTGPLGSGPDAIKPKSGRMNGLSWTMRFEPLPMSFPATTSTEAGVAWTPLRMIIKVAGRTNAGTDLTVETVRLVNMAAP